jgi:hypothetical protein
MGVDLTLNALVKIFADNFSVIRPEHKILLHRSSSQFKGDIKAIETLSKISKRFKIAELRDVSRAPVRAQGAPNAGVTRGAPWAGR